MRTRLRGHLRSLRGPGGPDHKTDRSTNLDPTSKTAVAVILSGSPPGSGSENKPSHCSHSNFSTKRSFSLQGCCAHFCVCYKTAGKHKNPEAKHVKLQWQFYFLCKTQNLFSRKLSKPQGTNDKQRKCRGIHMVTARRL